MKLVLSKALYPYFNFYGDIYYISEVLEHSCSYSIRCECLAQQMPETDMQLQQAMSA